MRCTLNKKAKLMGFVHSTSKPRCLETAAAGDITERKLQLTAGLREGGSPTMPDPIPPRGACLRSPCDFQQDRKLCFVLRMSPGCVCSRDLVAGLHASITQNKDRPDGTSPELLMKAPDFRHPSQPVPGARSQAHVGTGPCSYLGAAAAALTCVLACGVWQDSDFCALLDCVGPGAHSDRRVADTACSPTGSLSAGKFQVPGGPGFPLLTHLTLLRPVRRHRGDSVWRDPSGTQISCAQRHRPSCWSPSGFHPAPPS